MCYSYGEPMEKIVIGSLEVSEVAVPAPDQPNRLEPKLPHPVPTWARVAMSPLVIVLPLLCLFTIVLRFAMRGLPPQTRFAWLSFLSTLLVISGMVTSVAAVLAVAFVPLPSFVSASLGELDSRAIFPILPSGKGLTATDVSQQLKPLVAVISPARRTWFSHNEMPSNGFGAGVLLEAGPEGYLLLTARHVMQSATHFRSCRCRWHSQGSGLADDSWSPLADEQPTTAAALPTLRITPVSQSLTRWTPANAEARGNSRGARGGR